MTLLYLVTYALWIPPLVLQAVIALGMLRRGLVKRFPLFFSYTVVVFSGEIVMLFFKPNTNPYALIYWCTEILAVLLGLAVIFEILRHILPPRSSPRFVLHFVWVLAGLFAVTALLMLVLAKPTTGNYSMFEVVMLGERSVRFLQASLLTVVIALMSVLGITWQHESLGILAGFGVYSTVALAAYEFGPYLHWISHTAFGLLNTGAYNVAVLIWASYILRPKRPAVVDQLPDAHLAEWINTLNDDVDQWSERY